MMSQEARSELISGAIPELVRELLGPKDKKTLQSFDALAFNIIRNYRSISVNRYEVRRKLNDLKEKFAIDNLKEYGDHLEQLCDVVLNHPVCLQHYEIDIQWSLLDLLFSLAYNPTRFLRHNQHQIVIESPENTRENTFAQLEELYLKSILEENFIPVQNFDQNSDLSDWSESESEKENSSTSKPADDSDRNFDRTTPKEISLSLHLPVLQPPIKAIPFKLEEDKHDVRDYMKKNVQNLWWMESKQLSNLILSKRMEANFAILLSDYMKKQKSGFLNFRDPIITEEFCLLREIIWIFNSPQKCKYFSSLSGKIELQKNVTLPSISAPSLSEYLEYNILPYVKQMHSLRTFLKDIYDCQDHKLPKTLEYYAANLKGLLDPILDIFVDLEDHIVKQSDFEINTLITLQSDLRDIFKQLKILHAIHESAVFEYRKYPPHITSSYLLSSLMHCSNMATSMTESNLAISLFMSSIKSFCNIIDCWWTEGRLDDWHKEFLVECNPDQSISFRPHIKDKEKAFFVPKYMSKMIGENRFIRLILEHSMEAGYTLNLLYEISRIGDLRNECGAIGGNLYNAFIDDVFRQIDAVEDKIHNDYRKAIEVDTPDIARTNKNFTTTDEFLLLLFNSIGSENDEARNSDVCDTAENTKECRNSALYIFKKLEKSQKIQPLEELILSSFERILRERITFANIFVVNLYRENIDILRHLRNIRKVLLLEASDVMQQFYSKLFKQMETGQPWANSFVLTMQLDDTISNKYPEMSSLFRFEINSAVKVQTQKVTEAVEALTVSYTLSNELSKIITEDDMKVYNEVFRFLLKVKWGLATLENLKFARTTRRPPYAPLEMADFIMRRLEQLKFWMFYGVQCIHSHLMMHVLQTMGTQLDEKLTESKNVREMEKVHKSYLATISEHCFLKENLNRIKFGIEQMLNLVFVLRAEWRNCLKYLDQCTPLAVDVSGSTDDFELGDYSISAEIDTVEQTYIRCHQYLANMLNNEVYINQNIFLSGLSAAFNTSLPC